MIENLRKNKLLKNAVDGLEKALNQNIKNRAFLIRVGMDSTYGGFVSPIFPDKSFVFVPIPNVRDWGYQLDQPYDGVKKYSELKTTFGEPLTDYLPHDRIKVSKKILHNPANLPVHNDPEFVSNTYGEKKEKKVIYNKVKDFKKGDYIIFYGTFFPCPFGFKYKDYGLSELRWMQQRKKQFYIFAYLKLKYPPIDKSDYRQYEDEISNNAHYLRGDFEKHDNSFILKGTEDSGLIKPIRIDDGTRSKGNYYMIPNLARYKLKNRDKRGLNRCYCELESDVTNLIELKKLDIIQSEKKRTTGFIYTVNTLNKDYVQNAFCNVPTQYGNRIYFGPCKIPMRPRVKVGDFIFGISPSKVGKRKIVFITQVEERITFKEAYERLPHLRGPKGPIHVKPINKSGKFPDCCYEHIPGAIHPDKWRRDIASKDLDAFFVGNIQDDFVGRWYGKYGPDITNDIFEFLKVKCSVHGVKGKLSESNTHATVSNPIAYGRLYTGLHLETKEPNALLSLCRNKMIEYKKYFNEVVTPNRDYKGVKSCGAC